MVQSSATYGSFWKIASVINPGHARKLIFNCKMRKAGYFPLQMPGNQAVDV